MSNVTIKQMHLQYFKGIKNLDITFGNVTNIEGANASGKSTIVDAFFWLLWGKNAQGASDSKFLIKTVDENGVEIPHINHVVEGVLIVDGIEVTLKRVLVPEYDKEDNLSGNHTEYYWNEVPLKKSEYDQKIKGIIDEQVFKLITNPYAFLNMAWQDQRAMLLQMAGKVEDEEIAGTRKDFLKLMDKISGKTLEEYKREIQTKLQKINEAMKQIPTRIDEVKIGIPEEPDYEALKEEKAEVEAEIQKIDKAIEGYRMDGVDENLEKQKKIGELKMKQSEILSNAQVEERRKIHEYNGVYTKAEMDFKAIEEEKRIIKNSYLTQSSSVQGTKKSIEENISTIDSRLKALREEWHKENEKEFSADEELKCPLYGHGCGDSSACEKYEQSNEEAYTNFIRCKRSRLDEINATGKELNDQKKENEKLLADCLVKLEGFLKDFNTKNNEADSRQIACKKIMADNPKKPLISTIKGEDIEEWRVLGLEISRIESEIDDMKKIMDNETKEAEKANLKERRRSQVLYLDDIKRKMGIKEQIYKANERIASLESDLKNLGIEKARLEMTMTVITDFDVARMEAVSSRVNELFKKVTWQMYQRQINGEQVPACIALVDGVRWADANTASRINAGIDVASALATKYQCSAPMFIDNAECIGTIYDPGFGQRIILSHKRNAKLSITY